MTRDEDWLPEARKVLGNDRGDTPLTFLIATALRAAHEAGIERAAQLAEDAAADLEQTPPTNRWAEQMEQRAYALRALADELRSLKSTPPAVEGEKK